MVFLLPAGRRSFCSTLTFLRRAPSTLSWAGPRRTWTTIARTDRALTIEALGASFPYIWLRDSCQSAQCVHPSTSQKLHRTSDIPLDVAPSPGDDGVRLTTSGIRIVWNDGHESVYDRSFLERHSSWEKMMRAFHRDVERVPWNRRDIEAGGENHHLFVAYASLKEDDDNKRGLLVAIQQILKYGLLFVSGVPNAQTSNETCELAVLARLFGDIRPTFYGLLWDVVNVRNSRNIAYTNLDLGLHMDLLYFQHPPRYQILHCLRNRVVGGTSIFVDALQAAQRFRETNPSEFTTLTKTPVAFHYINDGHHLHHEHPTIELSVDGEINHINYSPPFQAPLPLSTPPEFYPALQKFAALLNDPDNMYRYTLREGDAVLFDNRRVLHARTAFEDIKGQVAEGETNRWLKGCYLEADAIMDRARVIQTQLEEN